MKISRFSVKHTPVLTMILIALALFGIVSLSSMNMEFIPDISLPQVFVISIYPGASAEDMERMVTDVLEDDFVTLPDFQSMTSQSMSSVSMVSITFNDSVDVYDQLDEVRNRISELRSSLPSGLQGDPIALVGGATMLPIFTFKVEGNDDIAGVTRYIEDELTPMIARIPGVSSIEVDGGLEPRVSIRLRLDDMAARGISPLTVFQLLSASNVSMPLGTADSGEVSINLRYDGEYSDISEIRMLPVGASDEGTIIRLQDIADITMENAGSDHSVFSYGEDVVVVSVSKRADGNTVQIANQMQEILARSEAETGGALRYEVISNDADIVLASLRNVIESGVMGILIAILVIYVFLNDGRATFVIGLSIPLSCFFSFILMKLFGITINLMSISGVVVALGSIVDASIVVLDQVYRYYQMEKDGVGIHSVTQSIYLGTDIVDKSVIGSNLTTVVVFIPLAMLSGIVGSILRDVSLTFMFSIFSSLIVAIVFVPYLLKKFLKEDGNRQPKKDFILVRGVAGLERGYRFALRQCLDHTPFALMIVLLVLALTIYSITQVGMAFIPSTDNNDFYINASFPYGYTPEKTRAAMEQIEDILIENVPELKTDLVYSGKSVEAMSFSTESNQGGIHAVLVPVEERERGIHEIIRDMQYRLSAAIPDATISVENGGFDYLVGYISGGGGYGITLVGDDTELLYSEAERIRDFLSDDPEVITASINTSYDSRTTVMDASYEYLSSLGLTSYEAAMTSAILFNGMDIGTYTDAVSDERYGIRLSSDAVDRAVDESLLSSIKLYTQAGSMVSMGEVADLVEQTDLSVINHSDRSTTMTVTARLTGESTTNVANRVAAYLAENPLAAGITTQKGGIEELIADSMGPVFKALLIAIFLVYMVIVLIYERFDQPFLIMLTVPFCVIGVVVSLAVFGSSMNMVSIMGIISLVGMLVNNGIIMVDYINQLETKSRLDAANAKEMKVDETDRLLIGFMAYDDEMKTLVDNIAEGAGSRLRPILMSALTTILGVVPMAVATGEGAEVYAPLGQVIMGGLTTSTFITLFLMPMLYFVLERHKIRKILRNKTQEDK